MKKLLTLPVLTLIYVCFIYSFVVGGVAGVGIALGTTISYALANK